MLTRENAARFGFVLSESALRRRIGTLAVMAEQLRHLAEVAKLPNVTLQVIPFDARSYAHLSTDFTLFRFGHEMAPSVGDWATVPFRKSSRSSTNGGNCVEVGEDEVALMFQHVDEAPEPLRKLVPETPAPLERLVLDLLAKHPADRPESAASVHERLVPFLPVVDQTGVDDVPPPGGVPDPTRPYRRPVAPRPRPRPVPEAAAHASAPDRDDIERALDAAAALVDEDRFTQAISLLSELIQPAVARFGRDATPVLDLRTSYAAALYLDGAFRQALPQFDALAASFERLVGPNAAQTLEYRRQAIECRVALGDTVDVLPEVESVLRGYQRLGHDNTREVLDLRLTIVRLRLGVGQRDEAGTELHDLYRDARRALGADDELTDVIREMAARLEMDAKDHR